MKSYFSSGTYFSGALVLIFLSFILLIGYINTLLPVSDLMAQHKGTVNVLYFLFAFAPLAWLFTSVIWLDSASIYRKILLVSLAIFLISTLYSSRYSINAGGFLFLCSGIFAFKEHKFYKPNPVFYWFWAYVLIQLISLCWTTDFHGGLNKFHVYLPFVTFPLAFCCFLLTREELDRLLLLFFRGATIFVFLSLFCWVYECHRLNVPLSDWFVLHKEMIAGQAPFNYIFSWLGYNHPSYNSIGYVLAFAIGIYLFDKRSSPSRVNFFEFVVFVFSALILTCLVQSRIGLINVLVLSVFGIAWLLRKRKKFLKAYIGVCILMALIVLGGFNEKIFGFTNDPVREQLFSTAIAYIKTNIWFGTGIGGMTEVLTSQEMAHKIGYPFAYTVHIYPHNQFLGDLMQAGLLGFIALIGMLGFLVYNCIKQRNWLMFSFLLGFLLFMMIEMPFFLLRGTTFFVPFACLLLQWKRRNETEK